MKKIFTLAIALIAFVGVASAQDGERQKTMLVNKTDGSTIEYLTSDVESVTFGEFAWVSLGTGIYGEDFIGTRYYSKTSGDLCCDYEVEIQENLDSPGLYRLVDPYAPDVYPHSNYTFYSYDSSQVYYIEVDATDPDCVWIDLQPTGVTDSARGAWWVYSAAGNYYAGGYDKEQIQALNLFGTLKDGVITFPYQTLYSYYPSYSSSSLYYANSHDYFKVVLPGYTYGAPKANTNVSADGIAVEAENTTAVATAIAK